MDVGQGVVAVLLESHPSVQRINFNWFHMQQSFLQLCRPAHCDVTEGTDTAYLFVTSNTQLLPKNFLLNMCTTLHVYRWL